MYVTQSLVHAILPQLSRHDIPIVMLPGANLSSYIYLETPDGREGWGHRFARDGYDVYVVNDPKLDFSRGFNVTPFTVPTEGAPSADPEAERAWQRDVWKRWGFGNPEGTPYPDTRFPTDHFDTFQTNYPYVGGERRSYSDSVIALLESVGPAIIMAHSAGASTAVSVGRERPDLVAGFIMVEPAGPPDADDFPELAGKWMLGVYGDYIASRNQTGRKEATGAAAVLFQEHGGAGKVISLPEDHDVYGNTHLMMQDNNSFFVADLIMDWLAENVETQADDVYSSVYVENALVHSILPRGKRHGVPVIMVPGLNLSSYIFVTTPDGREGWAQMFAKDGYDVHVINDPRFDFATGGFSVAPFTVPAEGMPPADPSSKQGWQRDIWRRWGFGESQGSPYPDARFPTDHFATFATNYPYVGSSGTSYSDAVAALLDKVGPAILMAHSAGGPQAVSAALARTNLVVGFILVEPTGPPDEDEFPALAGMSMFGVYADYIDSRNQGSRKTATEAAAVLFSQNGGIGEVVSLPDDLEVNGNSHLMMQGNNNGFIADLIIDWFAANVDTRTRRTRVSISSQGESLELTSPFRGIWQSSTNLVDWSPLSPDPVFEMVVTPGRPHEFFRQVH